MTLIVNIKQAVHKSNRFLELEGLKTAAHGEPVAIWAKNGLPQQIIRTSVVL
jgi:hypothetical protein